MSAETRFPALDALRGLAVATMVVFHATYDLHLFGHVHLDFRAGFWFGFPRFIAFLFLWCVGASLQLAHGQGVRWRPYWRRLLKLTALAVLISVATYVSFPQSWVYFGTLHCIAASSLLALPFLRWPAARWPMMILILLGQYALGYDIAWVSSLTARSSLDFIPVYPWFWVVLLGMISGPWLLRRLPGDWPLQRPLHLLGHHALVIYLVHQPLLYGLLEGHRRLVS